MERFKGYSDKHTSMTDRITNVSKSEISTSGTLDELENTLIGICVTLYIVRALVTSRFLDYCHSL